MTALIQNFLVQDENARIADDSINSSETITAKAVTMACLFAVSFICGLVPIKLANCFDWESNAKNKVIVMLMLCFGGGILMCTTFLHLLPEITEEIDELTKSGSFPKSPIHPAPLLMCAGFFIMYLVEECVHVYLHKREKQLAAKTLTRTLSIRRSELEGGEEMNSSSSLVKDSHKGACVGDHHLHLPQNDSVVMTIRGLLIVLALSVHELFEGLAVGLEYSASTVWYMFGAVAAHKFVIAFCIGVELVTSKTKTIWSVVYVFTFSVVSPIGIGIGILVSSDTGNSTVVVSVILQALATGTLLYVVFFEILQKDKINGLKSYCAILVGFLVMMGLTIVAED